MVVFVLNICIEGDRIVGKVGLSKLSRRGDQSESTVMSETEPLSDCEDESASDDTSITDISVSVSDSGASGFGESCVETAASMLDDEVVMVYSGFAKASLILGK